MTHAEVNNGGVTKSVDYANNPAGLRFMRVAGGVTKAWTYQGDNIASVESTTSPTLHSVYSGSGLGGVAERDDVDTAGGGSTTSRFYLYNHRGDVVGVSDASGNLTSAYDYDAYGAVSQSVQSGGGSAPTDDILFTGKDLDPDTGLYYFNARWYDSESGRWISEEPTGEDGPNLYDFCHGNPVFFFDPDGERIRVAGTPHEQALSNNWLAVLAHVASFRSYLDALNKSKHTITIQVQMVRSIMGNRALPASFPDSATPGVGSDVNVNLDIPKIHSFGCAPGTQEHWPMAVVLGHELFHAYQMDNGTTNYMPGLNNWPMAESLVVVIENHLRSVLIPGHLRPNYGAVWGK